MKQKQAPNVDAPILSSYTSWLHVCSCIGVDSIWQSSKATAEHKGRDHKQCLGLNWNWMFTVIDVNFVLNHHELQTWTRLGVCFRCTVLKHSSLPHSHALPIIYTQLCSIAPYPLPSLSLWQTLFSSSFILFGTLVCNTATKNRSCISLYPLSAPTSCPDWLLLTLIARVVPTLPDILPICGEYLPDIHSPYLW